MDVQFSLNDASVSGVIISPCARIEVCGVDASFTSLNARFHRETYHSKRFRILQLYNLAAHRKDLQTHFSILLTRRSFRFRKEKTRRLAGREAGCTGSDAPMSVGSIADDSPFFALDMPVFGTYVYDDFRHGFA